MLNFAQVSVAYISIDRLTDIFGIYTKFNREYTIINTQEIILMINIIINILNRYTFCIIKNDSFHVAIANIPVFRLASNHICFPVC